MIKLKTHPYSYETLQVRIDEAHIVGQPVLERPSWFENQETGQLYHDIYGCIGYPEEVKERGEEQPGYVAIVGVVRPDGTFNRYSALNANFQLLAEAEARDIRTLVDLAIDFRKTYGFGEHPELLRVFYGNPDRFITTLALRNEELQDKVLITPPVDFYDTSAFDIYIRSLKSCLQPGRVRFYFGGNTILKTHLKEFRRNNPAVFAVGGLVHSLLTHCTWMDSTQSSVFAVEPNNSW